MSVSICSMSSQVQYDFSIFLFYVQTGAISFGGCTIFQYERARLSYIQGHNSLFPSTASPKQFDIRNMVWIKIHVAMIHYFEIQCLFSYFYTPFLILSLILLLVNKQWFRFWHGNAKRWQLYLWNVALLVLSLCLAWTVKLTRTS